MPHFNLRSLFIIYLGRKYFFSMLFSLFFLFAFESPADSNFTCVADKLHKQLEFEIAKSNKKQNTNSEIFFYLNRMTSDYYTIKVPTNTFLKMKNSAIPTFEKEYMAFKSEEKNTSMSIEKRKLFDCIKYGLILAELANEENEMICKAFSTSFCKEFSSYAIGLGKDYLKSRLHLLFKEFFTKNKSSLNSGKRARHERVIKARPFR